MVIGAQSIGYAPLNKKHRNYLLNWTELILPLKKNLWIMFIFHINFFKVSVRTNVRCVTKHLLNVVRWSLIVAKYMGSSSDLVTRKDAPKCTCARTVVTWPTIPKNTSFISKTVIHITLRYWDVMTKDILNSKRIMSRNEKGAFKAMSLRMRNLYHNPDAFCLTIKYLDVFQLLKVILYL